MERTRYRKVLEQIQIRPDKTRYQVSALVSIPNGRRKSPYLYLGID